MQDVLLISEKVQRDAAREGFGWPSVSAALDKVQEELDELREWVENCDKAEFSEELGDLLFACIGVSVPSGCSSAAILQSANQKFLSRYDQMKSRMDAEGGDFEKSDLAEKLKHWNASK